MIRMNIIVAISGLLLVVLILWDVFVVLVLTRRATGQFQFTYRVACDEHMSIFSHSLDTDCPPYNQARSSICGSRVLLMQ